MLPFIFILLILLDQASKYLAEHFLATEKIHLLGDFLVLFFIQNTGVAFSFPIQGIILKVLTVVLIVGISVYYIRAEPYKNLWITKFSYVLILSGAISNGIDRVSFGSVINFIGVKYFAIFNFADIFICVGAFLLFLIYFTHEQP